MNNTLKTLIVVMATLTTTLKADFFGASPPYPPYCCDDKEMYINFFADILLWNAGLGGLEASFGDTTITTTLSTDHVTTYVDEKDVNLSTNWNAGIRFGADISFDCFELSADWTHFSCNPQFIQNSRTGPTNLTLGAGDYQHGHWRMHYDILTVILGRYWNIAPALYVKPYIGARWLMVNQNIQAHLQTLSVSPSGQTLIYTDLNDIEKIWGVGPFVGIEAICAFKYHLSAYANIGLISYYGSLRGKNLDLDTFTSTTSINLHSTKHNFNSLGTETAFGVRWDRNFVYGTYDIKLLLKLAWEEQRIYDFSNLGSDGALNLGGLAFGMGIEFVL